MVVVVGCSRAPAHSAHRPRGNGGGRFLLRLRAAGKGRGGNGRRGRQASAALPASAGLPGLRRHPEQLLWPQVSSGAPSLSPSASGGLACFIQSHVRPPPCPHVAVPGPEVSAAMAVTPVRERVRYFNRTVTRFGHCRLSGPVGSFPLCGTSSPSSVPCCLWNLQGVCRGVDPRPPPSMPHVFTEGQPLARAQRAS